MNDFSQNRTINRDTLMLTKNIAFNFEGKNGILHEMNVMIFMAFDSARFTKSLFPFFITCVTNELCKDISIIIRIYSTALSGIFNFRAKTCSAIQFSFIQTHCCAFTSKRFGSNEYDFMSNITMNCTTFSNSFTITCYSTS